jgi:Fe2+ transport system protein FeoA
MNNEINLDTVAENKEVKVVRLEGSRPDQVRMMQMGLTPGTAVQVLRRAPLADPVEIKVRGTKILLRRDECRNIRVAGEE